MFRADVNGLMDQMEDKELLLKQSLKDMEDALARNRLRKNSLEQGAKSMAASIQRLEKTIEEVEPGLEAAVRHGKDDLARDLIRRQKNCRVRRRNLMGEMEKAEKRAKALSEQIEEQKEKLETLRAKISQWMEDRRVSEKTAADRFFDLENPDLSRVSEADVESELLLRKEACEGGNFHENL
jgi:phage shock protein A